MNGLCKCGCGAVTGIATRTYAKRGVQKGQPLNYVSGHNVKSGTGKYERIVQGGKGIRVHRQIAERALGKPLRASAPVHHVDDNPRNNANSNLVICQDNSYHKLLHMRARIVRSGGNPNTDRMCGKCKKPKPIRAFYKTSIGPHRRTQGWCIECVQASRKAA